MAGLAGDAALITGYVTAEEITPVDGSCGHDWITEATAEQRGLEGYSDLEEDEAVCHLCGAESEVNDRSREKNVVVDVAGAEFITDLIDPNAANPGDFDLMKIGSTASPSSPTEGDTQLSNTVATSPVLTPSQTSTGGAEKKLVYSNTFASSTGRSSVVSLGIDTTTATGAGAQLLNRVTFSAKDNANNDLALTYELTVS
jgi:hypothetical protein